LKSIKDILQSKDLSGDTRNKHEFQAYGNRLADELGDQKHRALYIKLAKQEDRNLLEKAREFVVGQENVTTKGRLFMWKLGNLKKEKKLEDTA
jgi:hypothetical protein